ncbi:MAG: aminotransferase class I/II-fold pyridoxal phosphate-dependent enzyme [Coriobacteriales bacterium]|nr:aminotransferase class I/II-fold pyridoxal phosphate-dependent enzyme [Coriobacteriales bacterium]
MDWENYFIKQIKDLDPYKQGLQKKDVRKIAKSFRLHKLSSNESPYGPFPSAQLAISAGLSNLSEYCDGGFTKLKDAISKRYNVDKKNISCSNGSVELIYFIAQVSLKKGDEVITCWPSFVTYETVVKLAKAKFTKIPLDINGKFNLKKIAKSISSKTKMIFLCNPNNPSGTVITKKEFEKFYKSVPKDILILIDEAYIEFADPDSTFDSLKYFDNKSNIAILRTFSKMYGLAGLRCGYCFAPEELIKAIDKVRQPFNVNSLAQKAACASIKDTHALNNRIKKFRQEKEYLLFELDNLAVKLAIKYDCLVSELKAGIAPFTFYYYDTQANFIFICLSDFQNVNKKLLEKGVICRLVPGGIRITIGSTVANKAVIKALTEILI